MFVIVAGGDGAAFVLAVSPVAAAAVHAAALQLLDVIGACVCVCACGVGGVLSVCCLPSVCSL